MRHFQQDCSCACTRAFGVVCHVVHPLGCQDGNIFINLACHISGIDFCHLVNGFVTKLSLLGTFPNNIGGNYLLCTFGVIKNILLLFPAFSLFLLSFVFVYFDMRRRASIFHDSLWRCWTLSHLLCELHTKIRHPRSD